MKLCKERGFCRKALDFLKEKWEPLNKFLKIGLTLLFFAGTVMFLEYWYVHGFLVTLKGTIDILGFIAILGGATLTIGGAIAHFEK
jgi:polyferredoxin